MKIINSSNKPYEFTYDGGHYGPYKPGEILDLPDDMALFAIHKSAVLVQDPNDPGVGEVEYYQMQSLDSMSKDKIREIVSYECSLVRNGLCDAKPFRTMNELKAHMDLHFEMSSEPVVVKAAATAPVQQAIRK